MNSRPWLGLMLLSPCLIGCTPDGPPEIYRGALQARSEFVDTLSRVVDEPSAKESFAVSYNQFLERIKSIDTDQLDRVRRDDLFNKLRRDTFDLKKLEPNDRAVMIEGLKAYAAYCKNVVFTNARLKRELERLRMVANLELLAKARTQLASNQPVQVSEGADCPKLSELFAKMNKPAEPKLRYLPAGVVKEQLDKLNSGLDDATINLIATFDPQNLDVKVPDFEPPALPSYPQWAIEVDRRANLGLIQRPHEKR